MTCYSHSVILKGNIDKEIIKQIEKGEDYRISLSKRREYEE